MIPFFNKKQAISLFCIHFPIITNPIGNKSLTACDKIINYNFITEKKSIKLSPIIMSHSGDHYALQQTEY